MSYVINVLLNHPLDYNSKPKNIDKLAKLVHKNLNQKDVQSWKSTPILLPQELRR